MPADRELTSERREQLERTIRAWRAGSAFSSLDHLDGPRHGADVAELFELLDAVRADLGASRRALRTLLAGLRFDDTPRRAAIDAAKELAASWPEEQPP